MQRKVFFLVSVTWPFLTWTDGLQRRGGLRRASDAKAGEMASLPLRKMLASVVDFGFVFQLLIASRHDGQDKKMKLKCRLST